jgi:hypothetical protein
MTGHHSQDYNVRTRKPTPLDIKNQVPELKFQRRGYGKLPCFDSLDLSQ